jgi:putative ABC transport system permease protein
MRLQMWWARLRAAFRRRALDEELRDEIEAHVQMEADALVADGVARDRAVAQARRGFGNRAGVREAAADMWSFGSAETLVLDVRYAIRLLRRAPGFTSTAVAMIALGIGGASATFALFDHVLLKPLPFDRPDGIVLLHETRFATGVPRTQTSPANFLDWRDGSSSFEAMGAYVSILLPVNLSGRDEPRRLESAHLTSAVFDVLGVRPAAGRAFTAADERAGAGSVVMISHALAASLFGSVQSAVDQIIRLDDQAQTIVGVMPADFAFPSRDAQIWQPLRVPPQALAARRNHLVYAVARLRPGVTIAQARADMNVVAAALERAYPKENGGTGIAVVDLRELLLPSSRTLVAGIFTASLCLLVIACMSLANLLVARAVARRREIAIRIAMGAGQQRVVRQLLAESLVLSLLGGAVGLVAAFVVTPPLALLVPAALPVNAMPTIDWRSAAFALALTLATSLVFGLGPAVRSWRSARSEDVQALRSRSTPAGSSRVRAALVFAEVVGTVLLLVGVGLLVKSLWQVQSIDPGFRTAGVLRVRTALPMPKYASPARRRDFYDRVLDGTTRLPGVRSAAYTSYHPMEFASGRLPVVAPGFADDPLTAPQAVIHFITPGVFDTLGIPLRSGRDVSERDTESEPFVAIVSETLASRLWPGREPLGQRLIVTGSARTVVGVAADIAVRRLEGATDPQIYFPAAQLGQLSSYYAPRDLLVRSGADPLALAPAVRRIVHGIDPNQAVDGIQPLADIVAAQTAPRREQAAVLAAFAAMALLMAVIGLNGLLSYGVSSRTQEVGVRIALGAGRGQVFAMFLRQGLLLGGAGVLVAMPLAYAAAGSMRPLLFNVGPGDPSIYGLAAAVVLLLTIAGSVRPALRAARIDPATAIRAD